MKLIIGLGNPGEKYKNNRHNAGFIMLDEIQKELNFPEFEFEKRFDSKISKNKLEIGNWKLEILLIKPQTFMNNSGEAAQKIMSFYKLTPADIIVIHDDLDIEIGNYKISSESSAAGHNGVQDIMDKLGTQNFKRIRIGVETEGGRINRQISGEDFVLQNFTEDEMGEIKNISNDVLGKIKKYF